MMAALPVVRVQRGELSIVFLQNKAIIPEVYVLQKRLQSIYYF